MAEVAAKTPEMAPGEGIHGDGGLDVLAVASVDDSFEHVAPPPTEDTERNEEDGEEQDDGFLDVVVTSVDDTDVGTAPSVTQAIASSLSAAGPPAYTVELVVTKGATSYCVQRPLPALIDVLQRIEAASTPSVQLLSLAVASDATESATSGPQALPDFPPKGSRSDALLAQWCGDMTAYLAARRTTSLRLHPDWLAFVREQDADKSARAHMTAIDFILQPFAFEKLYVARGSRHEAVVAVPEAGHFVVWKFELEDLDVDFSVSFVPEPFGQPVELVHARTRYLATPTGRAIEGMHQCPRAGRVTLVWDNSYSRLRGKNILYQAQVVSGSIMDSATAAADALDEAVQAERKRDQQQQEALATALIVSPNDPAESTYSQYLPEALSQPSWLLSAPMSAAGLLASRLFGSQEETAVVVSKGAERDGGNDSEARSLLEELNGLNMQLMERMESLEDSVGKLTVERDQARSKTHLAVAEKENLASEVAAKEQELASLAGELQRIEREREAWREIQTERDALLEEKHRWALTDDFDGGDDTASAVSSDMDSESRRRLEQELGQAEAAVLRCRAELGYSLSNHLTGTSTRLEKVAHELAATKQRYEEQMATWSQEKLQVTQQLVKARGQKRVLVTELRNMRTQTEGQVAVAMAEAGEARMVNRRLKKQNELLLTQIRTLIGEAEENERKLQLARDQQKRTVEITKEDTKGDTGTGGAVDEAVASEEEREEVDQREVEDTSSTVPYTLSEDDIALLNGRKPPSATRTANVEAASSAVSSEEGERVTEKPREEEENPFRARLVAFFEERDPDKLSEVDEMLASYRGVEDSLFESLELKYSFMEINQRIAQAI